MFTVQNLELPPRSTCFLSRTSFNCFIALHCFLSFSFCFFVFLSFFVRFVCFLKKNTYMFRVKYGTTYIFARANQKVYILLCIAEATVAQLGHSYPETEPITLYSYSLMIDLLTGWIIDWCLAPMWAVFQLYSGVNQFYNLISLTTRP